MPTPLTPPTLESVLQGLHESEIRCGIQNEPPAGGITAWIDYDSRTEKATFYGTIVGDRQVWAAADRIAAWMHGTALRLFPDSPPMPKSTAPKRRKSRRSPPKISALERTAVRIMRKLYEATGGQPQRWESLGNLGVVASDAAGIAYAVERGWLIISGGLHPVSLTEAGRQRLK
jgi:hypothetical protein